MFREKIIDTTADRPQLKKLMAVLSPGDIVIISAVDRLSRDTTDLLVIARDMQRAGAGLRSLAEPVLNTTGDFAELVLAMLGVAAKQGAFLGLLTDDVMPEAHRKILLDGMAKEYAGLEGWSQYRGKRDELVSTAQDS